MTKNCVICGEVFDSNTPVRTTCKPACARNEFKGFIKDEADNLRRHATTEELARLNFRVLRPKSKHLCIYGQMTGDCYSVRAAELLNLCSKPYSKAAHAIARSVADDYGRDRVADEIGRNRDYSPIETYICEPNSNIKGLIEYLKSESSTLKL
jgi:predicted  nucleic acid-binding Zn-ribbon protein